MTQEWSSQNLMGTGVSRVKIIEPDFNTRRTSLETDMQNERDGQKITLQDDWNQPAPGPTKNLPLRPHKELSRPRLAVPDSLRNGHTGLAGIFAPAGYGKSTLMANWRDALTERGVACCWLNFREKHRDPKIMLQALLHALAQHLPKSLVESTQRNLKSANSHVIGPVLASLMLDVETNGQRIVLFLDALDNLGQSPGRDAIALLIEHRPKVLSLVLAGRDAQQFSLSRYRLAGRMVEMRAQDLAFTAREIDTLLREHFALALDEDGLNTVVRRTEGWPAAVGLYALGAAARGGESIDSLVDFTSTADGLADQLAAYLSEILLESLDPHTRNLLLRAAVPDHFSLGLLQELLPGTDAAQALEKIRGASLFLHSSDDEYRFHSLCGEFLRRRLRQSSPELFSELLNTAGRWCWVNNQPYEAVNYAKRAGDWELMAERICLLANDMVRGSGELDTYMHWFRELPAEVSARYPELYLHQAWALVFSRDVPQAKVALSRLEALLDTQPGAVAQSYRRQLDCHRFLLEALMDRGHLQLSAMAAWLERHPDAPDSEKVLCTGALGSAARNANQLDRALDALQQSEDILRRGDNDYTMSWIHNARLSVLLKKGDFSRARIAGHQGLAMICETLGEQSPAAGMSNAMLAYLAYEKGDLQAAHQHLDQSMRFIANQGVVEPLYFAHLTQSWLVADEGNPELSPDILLEGEELGLAANLPRLTAQLATRRALHYLHMDDRLAAEAIIETRRLLDYPNDEFQQSRARFAELLRINMDLLQGRFRDAAERSCALSRTAAKNGTLRMQAEYEFLLAISLLHNGEANEAGRRFREQLATAAVQERYRFMLQYGKFGKSLIAEQLQARSQAWTAGAKLDAADTVLKKLAAALSLDEAGQAPPKTNPAPLEGLTRREIDILKRADHTGLNNKQLAEALFVSEGTLKWHLHNIYSKLEVRNRAGAIKQAQHLGLLE